MPWWGILLTVLFCDWTALFVLGKHLSNRATKAVEKGVDGVKSSLFAMVPVLLNTYKISLEKSEVPAQEGELAER